MVDFVCAERRLIVEVDGDSHQEQLDYDEARTEHLSAYDYHVLRFTNYEVFNNLDRVLGLIEHASKALRDSNPLPELGEGGEHLE